MSLTSNNKSRLEKEAGCTIITVLCCNDDEDVGDVGDKGRPVEDADGRGAVAGKESALGNAAFNPPLVLEAEMRGRGGGRLRLLKREQTPNKLTPDCRHSSTVTSSTPSSFCSASLNTRSMSQSFERTAAKRR